MIARVLNVTEQAYHADPCVRPSLSSSIAHTLVTQSPRHAWLEHPKLGGNKDRVASKTMDEGAILHKLLLGAGAQFEMVIADDWRTNAAKEARAAIEAEGKIAILAKNFEKLKKAADRLFQNAANQGFPFGGRSELAIEFVDYTNPWKRDREVLCRCRIDQVTDAHTIYDVKKVASANPKDIARKIVEYGYDIQATAYKRAYEQLVPEALGRSDFVFLFCEPEPPYEVVPARLDGYHIEIGQRRWNRAVALWDKLLTEGSYPWPGYADGAITLIPPQYVINQELGDEAA
jgi:PDDEXK-like domain of unknown function (DUF3799)